MDSIKIRLGRNIETCRKRAGLSRDALAEACKVSPGTVGNWERGERWPEYENVAAIAKLINIPETNLFDGEIAPIVPTISEALDVIVKSVSVISRISPNIINRLAGADEDQLRRISRLFEIDEEAQREADAEALAERNHQKRKKV